jgi:hypothetical protein
MPSPRKTSRKTTRQPPRSTLPEGAWGPQNEEDSNLRVTVRGSARAPRVEVVDPFDGEKLKVSGVSWDGEVLRFRTVTPSTKFAVDHELRVGPSARAEHRYTLSEPWQKLSAPEEGEEET